MNGYNLNTYKSLNARISKQQIGEKPLQSTVGDDITISGGKYIDKAFFLLKNQFKLLYADLILSQTNEDIIRYMSSEEAFKVVEMELSFLYDVLYTKAIVVYSLLGMLLRIASFLSTISTLAAFFFFIDSKKNSLTDSIYGAISSLQSVLTSDKRWSRRMAQNNLIDSCLRDKTKFNQVPRFFDMNKFLERYCYMTWENVDDMKEPIFSCLLQMINKVNDTKQLLKHRGDYVITKRVLLIDLVGVYLT